MILRHWPKCHYRTPHAVQDARVVTMQISLTSIIAATDTDIDQSSHSLYFLDNPMRGRIMSWPWGIGVPGVTWGRRVKMG